MAADEGHLIERAKSGDREAFGALVRKHQRKVYATAYKLMGNHHDADDVSQDAFLRAYRALASFDQRAAFSTWLHRIVINTGLNTLRKRKRQPAASPITPCENTLRHALGSSDPSKLADARELLTAVCNALDELSPTLRNTFVLAAIEGQSYKEISTGLDVPEGTVAWRVSQARKELSQKLSNYLPNKPSESADELLRRARTAISAS